MSRMIDETAVAVGFAAKWITPPGDRSANYTFLARREFRIAEVPERAILRIAADSRYVAYLNGLRIGQGPARGTDARFFFDSYDVSADLRPERNCLALRVHCPTVTLTSAVPPVMPAILAEIEGLLATDADWQVRPDPAHRADAPFYTHHIGYSEYRDLRKEPVGWQTCDDAPDGWLQAQEAGDAEGFGGRTLSPRDIPDLTADRYQPARVVAVGGVPPHREDIEDDVEYAMLMQAEMHLTTARTPIEDADALTCGGPARVITAPHLTPGARGEGAYVVLDFERELCGNFALDVEAPAGTIVDVGYDELAVNGRVDARRVNPNGTVYRFADRYVLRAGRQRIETRLHDRGLRVIQLVFRRFAEPILIHAVEVVNRVYPILIQAEFECSDPLLNRLWDMSRATLSACSLDVFVDCPWREQTLWLDDHLQENLFYLTLSSDRAFPAHNLRVSAEGALPNGMIAARYPSERTCLLPVTSSNWVTVLNDYYRYTGDLALVRELLPVVDRALDLYDAWREEDGLVADRQEDGMWNFIDWGYPIAGVQLGGKTAALNMLIAAAFRQAADLHAAAGDGGRADALRRGSREIVAAVRERFWLRDERHFYDCTEPGDGRRTFSQIPHAVGAYFDLLEDAERDMVLDALLDPEAVRAEYGYQLFVLDALVRGGRAAQALEIVRMLWGHMANAGSPTFWEVADGRSSMAGCGSLCHAFSCSPMYFAQTALLGVRPLKPGFEQFLLDPRGAGVAWARGKVPTPHGQISVERTVAEDESITVDVCIPEGTVAVLPDGRRLTAGEQRVTI